MVREVVISQEVVNNLKLEEKPCMQENLPMFDNIVVDKHLLFETQNKIKSICYRLANEVINEYSDIQYAKYGKNKNFDFIEHVHKNCEISDTFYTGLLPKWTDEVEKYGEEVARQQYVHIRLYNLYCAYKGKTMGELVRDTYNTPRVREILRQNAGIQDLTVSIAKVDNMRELVTVVFKTEM